MNNYNIPLRTLRRVSNFNIEESNMNDYTPRTLNKLRHNIMNIPSNLNHLFKSNTNKYVILFILTSILIFYYSLLLPKLTVQTQLKLNNFGIQLLMLLIFLILVYNNLTAAIVFVLALLIGIQLYLVYNKDINVNNDIDNDNDYDYSPKTKSIIDSSFAKAKYHNDLAKSFGDAGNIDNANKHLNEVQNQKIKINLIIQNKQYLKAVKDAEKNNSPNLINHYIQSIHNNNTKLSLIFNSEELKNKADEAYNNGNITKSNELNDLAIQEDIKLQKVLKADELILKANEAKSNHDDSLVEKYLNEAMNIYNSIANTPPSIPGNDTNINHSLVEFDENKENPESVIGYYESDYANW
jgi:hypothetical protein